MLRTEITIRSLCTIAAATALDLNTADTTIDIWSYNRQNTSTTRNVSLTIVSIILPEQQ